MSHNRDTLTGSVILNLQLFRSTVHSYSNTPFRFCPHEPFVHKLGIQSALHNRHRASRSRPNLAEVAARSVLQGLSGAGVGQVIFTGSG